MKKYTKPKIVYESFELSTHIAAGCDILVNNPTQGTCPLIVPPNLAIFDSSIPACLVTPQKIGFSLLGDLDSACYHIPVEDNNLFNS